ncbi:MAG: XRE family transcriptional regulator [Sphingobacteriales bacterium]|nr:MAG: XRE family transcriptional regulator [Sphingobacteriales bacterium]
MKGKANRPKKKELDVDEQLRRLGQRIKQLRKEHSDSYETFAFENDLPRAQYGRYEKGSDLRFSSLIKVLNALGITPKEFFSDGFE